MGFFKALFGSQASTSNRIDAADDRVWLTAKAKLSGLATEIDARSKTDSVAILLVAHFPDVLAQLQAIAESQAAKSTAVPVMAVLAEDLSVDMATGLNLDETATIDLIVGQRHPLPSVDAQLERFADELPCRCRFSHHLSLDDPMMKMIMGERVQKLLGSLGMAEDEAIESSMVTRRIKAAQDEIEGKVTGNQTADSAAEWLQKNCPELLGGSR